MTRLLYLTESFHPVFGGGERHIREIGSRLAASGTPVTVVTRRGEASWPEEEGFEGMRVVRVPPTGPARTGKYWMVPGAVAALARERAAYDVVLVPGTRVLGLPALLAARSLGKRIIFQAEVNGEMSGEIYTWGTRFHEPVYRRLVEGGVELRNTLMRDADAFVAISTRIRAEFVEAGVPEEKVFHIPHAVDTARFHPVTPQERDALRARLGLPGGRALITYTGRLLKGKGLETLVEAFSFVAPRHPAAHLLFVGSGSGQALSVEDAIRARVQSGSLAGRVTFTGRVDNVHEYLQASDVFAFPSIFEALGLSLVEAASCALPGVGSRTGGIVDIIEEGRSGWLFEPGDGRGLAAALESLLADAGRRAAFGARGREIARARFDLEDSVDRYRALVNQVAAGA